MDKKSVYLETSFVSYLTSTPSRDLVTAGHQAITSEWWETEREVFTLYVSPPVRDEAMQGNSEMAEKRLSVIDTIESLAVTDDAIVFGQALIESHAVPAQAATDALHVAISCVHGMDYLLTWNCRHIANAHRFRDIEKMCRQYDLVMPIIFTPEELPGGTS